MNDEEKSSEKSHIKTIMELKLIYLKFRMFLKYSGYACWKPWESLYYGL